MDAQDGDAIEPALPDTLDEEDFDGTSDYGGSLASSGFTSLASSVRRHTHEDGRRYQSFAEGRYPIPNDETEQFREEMKHQMVKRLFDGKDYLSPIGDHPQKILDIGTGTGVWAVDVADKFPSAHVIGVDISAIQNQIAPLNVDWRIDDIEQPWSTLYSDLDFVHCRAVVQTLRDPVAVVESAYRNLKPGGWLEVQESGSVIGCDDGTLPADYPLFRFMELLDQAFKSLWGWDIDVGAKLPGILEKIGFVNINFKRHKLPIGGWARDKLQREIGLYVSRDVLWQFVRAVLVKHTHLGLTKQEADNLERDIKSAFNNTRIHATLPWYSVWAQKPLT